MKKVILESHVPFVGDAFEGVAEVEILAPELITPETVKDADALIVRTRTRCNHQLLEGSKVGFVATATIGTDHIDKEYCAGKGIEVVSAPGCNAPAVAQYTWSAILTALPGDWRDATVGVVGVGYVGSLVARWGKSLGVNILLCDPPLERMGATPRGFDARPEYHSLDYLARHADVITFHTPHTRTGLDATHHLANERFFNAAERMPLIVNAARGPVVDTEALLRAIDAGRVKAPVIDCWEGEPEISEELFRKCAIATPHIAGYSLEGKLRATQNVVNNALRWLGSDKRINLIDIPSDHVPPLTAEKILADYSPLADTATMRDTIYPDIPLTPTQRASAFERLRNTYPLRSETR